MKKIKMAGTHHNDMKYRYEKGNTGKPAIKKGINSVLIIKAIKSEV